MQSDESGKEAKWADIDDDEEDWAPETVVWMDGTKSTITPQEVLPAPKEEKPATPQPPKPAEPVKPTLTTIKRPDQAMKILKPGAATANQAKQSASAGSSPAPDKQSLKAKSPGPAPPSKSPWAPVPKVEMVSPINPPIQQPPPPQPLAPQDARAYEPSSSQPAREIAADTFDRSWRESEGGTRELFNSANGRYEPAPEGRRSSMKADAGLRKTAVLRRPSQTPTYPAEPSSAFQTRSTAQADGYWGRRRGSSISQGSLPPARRMSVTKANERVPTPEGQTGTSIVSNDSRFSPIHGKVEPVNPTFAQQSVWDQQMPSQVEDESTILETSIEDPVKMQERVMREKRELAIKRRKEEEEREEAAKQERLKAKLAMLEGAGKSKKERDAEAAAVAAQSATSETSTVEQALSTNTEDMHTETAKLLETSSINAPSLDHQILPTAAEKAQLQVEEQLSTPGSLPKPLAASLPDRPISSSDSVQRQAPRANLSPRAATRAPQQQQTAGFKAPPSSYSSPGDRKPQPYGRSPLPNENAFSPWPTTAPNSNVWGTSGIGNGTFESTNNYAPVPMSQQGSSLPPPPGMTRPATSTRISPQGFGQDSRSPNLQPSQATDQQRAFPPPGIEARHDQFANQARLSGVSPAPGLGRKAHPPGPIGPPSRTQQPPVQRADPISGWNSAAQVLPHQTVGSSEVPVERNMPESHVASASAEYTFREKFRQTSTQQGQLGATRRYDKPEYTVHDTHGSRPVSTISPVPPSAQTQPSGPFSTVPATVAPWKEAEENTVRIPDGSQNPSHGGLHITQPPIGPPGIRPTASMSLQEPGKFMAFSVPPAVDSKDQSPPPPEIDSHPVNSGDISHPHVKLPPPQAKVRLPPASPVVAPRAPIPTSSAMITPRSSYSNWGPPGAAKPIVMNEAWQARFNGLFNRTPIQTETPPSPPKTPPKVQGLSLAVASSTRAPMDHQAVTAARGTTVSLPQATKSPVVTYFVADNSSDVSSKPIIDEMFNEELSFGSLPKINVPRVMDYDMTPYPSTAKSMLAMSSNSKFIRTVVSQTHPEMDAKSFYKHPHGYFLKIRDTPLNNKFVKEGPTNDHRKTSGATGDYHERRASSKQFHKARNSKDGNVTPSSPATPSGASNSVSRKSSSHQKTVPTPAMGNSSSASSKPSQNETSTSADRKKTVGVSKPPSRGNNVRHQAASPIAAVKSS